MYSLLESFRRTAKAYEEEESEKRKEFRKKQYFYNSSLNISLLRHQCIEEVHNVELLYYQLQDA